MKHLDRIEAVFLDRDGVINYDSPEYIKSWAEFDFIPGSRKALALLASRGLKVFLVTNQSAVGRGIIAPQVLAGIHERMQQQIEAVGGRIEEIFFCPHRPEENCSCRKPQPGLILRAAARYGLQPASTVMIGDSAKDIQAARAAGCRAALLVKTGNWRQARAELAAAGRAADGMFDNLLEAAKWLVAELCPHD